MAKIVVMGAGLGGVACAYEMKKKLGSGAPGHAGRQQRRTSSSRRRTRGSWSAGARRRRRASNSRSRWPTRTSPGCRRWSQAIDAPASTLTLADGTDARLRLPGDRDRAEARVRGSAGSRPEGIHAVGLHARPRARRPGSATRSSCRTRARSSSARRPGASCFGPAYETAMILDTDLRRRKIRDRVPMTFVTAEPYIGHMGLGGVGDSKGLMESELRQRHINWITNAKIIGRRGRRDDRRRARRGRHGEEGAQAALQVLDGDPGVQGRRSRSPRCRSCATRAASC